MQRWSVVNHGRRQCELPMQRIRNICVWIGPPWQSANALLLYAWEVAPGGVATPLGAPGDTSYPPERRLVHVLLVGGGKSNRETARRVPRLR